MPLCHALYVGGGWQPDGEGASVDSYGFGSARGAGGSGNTGNDRDAWHSAGAEEQVERQLASFAFIREEREREVRLHFRDVPAGELAMSFRRSGASLISLMGERARVAPLAAEPDDVAAPVVDEPGPARSRRRRRSHSGADATPPGEVTVRYFYSLGELVYTISIAAPSGVVQSIARIYPNAAFLEQELQGRLGVVFVDNR